MTDSGENANHDDQCARCGNRDAELKTCPFSVVVCVLGESVSGEWREYATTVARDHATGYSVDRRDGTVKICQDCLTQSARWTKRINGPLLAVFLVSLAALAWIAFTWVLITIRAQDNWNLADWIQSLWPIPKHWALAGALAAGTVAVGAVLAGACAAAYRLPYLRILDACSETQDLKASHHPWNKSTMGFGWRFLGPDGRILEIKEPSFRHSDPKRPKEIKLIAGDLDRLIPPLSIPGERNVNCRKCGERTPASLPLCTKCGEKRRSVLGCLSGALFGAGICASVALSGVSAVTMGVLVAIATTLMLGPLVAAFAQREKAPEKEGNK